MHLVHFQLLKSSKLTNDSLEIENLKRNFDLGITMFIQKYILMIFSFAK
jgi:hypothetical protein